MEPLRILWADRSHMAIDRFAQIAQSALSAEITQIDQSINGIAFVEMTMHPYALLIWEVDAILGPRLEQTFRQRWPITPTFLFTQYRSGIQAFHYPDQGRHALHRTSVSPEAFVELIRQILFPPSSLTPP